MGSNRSHFVILLAFLVIGCFPPSPEIVLSPEKSQYVPYSFKYTLPDKKFNADFTLALITPSFVFLGNNVSVNSEISPSYSEWLFKKQMEPEAQDYVDKLVSTYLGALQTDLEKVLVATGNRTIGPFIGKENITYPQRQQSDFVFEPKLKILLSEEETEDLPPYQEEVQITKGPKQKNVKTKPISGNPEDDYSYTRYQKQIQPGERTGNISIVAQLEIHLYEPVTWEKMWIKSITIPVSKKQYTYKYSDEGGKKIFGEDTRPKILSEVLTSSYKQILDEFLKYFDPNELKAIDTKGKEIREKKKF